MEPIVDQIRWVVHQGMLVKERFRLYPTGLGEYPERVTARPRSLVDDRCKSIDGIRYFSGYMGVGSG